MAIRTDSRGLAVGGLGSVKFSLADYAVSALGVSKADRFQFIEALTNYAGSNTGTKSLLAKYGIDSSLQGAQSIVPETGTGSYRGREIELKKTQDAYAAAARIIAGNAEAKKVSSIADIPAPKSFDQIMSDVQSSLNAIQVAVESSSKSVSESEQAYFNRKDELAQYRVRGIGMWMSGQPLKPIGPSSTGTLVAPKLEGK